MAIDDVRKYFLDWIYVESDDGLGESLIALEANWDGNPDIFIFSPDTQARVNVTESPYDETTPAWSPDGTLIAFSSNATDTREVWVIDVETHKVKQLTDFGGVAVAPRWSSNGQQIAFFGAGIVDNSRDYDLFVMDSDGSNVRRITNFEGNEGFPDWRPCPDEEAD